MHHLGRQCLLSLSSLAILLSNAYADDAREAERAAQFEREIRPVLIGQCIQCHGAKKQEGGLRLDTREGLLKGGDSGAIVTPGKPDESLLVDALHHRGVEMPPKKKLADKVILHFERWVAAGAVWPDSIAALRETDGNITDLDRNWWAFQPLKKINPPHSPDDQWSQNDVDRFVWNALSAQQLSPAPRADRAVLIRRLYFDLIGLPPSVQEIDEFVRDQSPQAWARAVDRLLEDPRYGEHWARFWLDLVRYSESDGWNQDAYRPVIYRYRDYVVDAFNRDTPYPRFVLDQLAGDERADDPEGMIAAGFLRLGIYEYNQRDARGQWNDIMNEMTDVVGDAFMGMSMACARCHQHKFDPIPQRDYFKLRAFLEPVIWRDDLIAATEKEMAEHKSKSAEWEAATASVRAELAALLEPYEKKKWFTTVDKFPLDIQACFHLPHHDRTSWQEQMAYMVSRQYLEEGGGPFQNIKKEDKEKREALEKELAKFDHLKPKPLPQVMTVTDFDGILSPTTNPDDSRREPIAPGYMEVLAQGHDMPIAVNDASVRPGSTGRRTALAKWIGHPNNPLTMRVFVNRIWQQHFGQGIVSTSNDFGHLGDKPTHPELLDWLTAKFIESGFSMKELHRTILASATWQQSAHHPEASRYQTVDPGERLLWRSRVRRLQAEQIRDAMLTASAELKTDIGGPSVTQDVPRRSVYLKSFRNQNDTFVHGFDAANGLQSVANRDTTTTPTQSLLLFNGKYVLGRAEATAKRLAAEFKEPETVVKNAFRSIWGREPSQSDLESAERYVGLSSGEDAEVLDPGKLADLCHILFNSNQFLYLE
ncbi:MAG: PSD1 and planctomycete cytochrome C domain-containing protein [Pirellulales bacterium]